MKRFILILSLITLALTFTACKIGCAHQYGEWTVTKPATCIEEGVQTRVCTLCSAEDNSSIEKTEHTEVYDNSINPTCTESGLSWGKHCSVCGLVTVEQTPYEPLGHTVKVEDTTCVEDENLVRICDRCDYFIPFAEHTPVTDKGYPATETSEGLTDGEHCSVCGDVLVVQKIIPKLGTGGPSFSSGYVTTKQTVITTKHLDLKIDANVFVPDNLVEILDVFTTAIEELSGLSFEGNPHYVYAPLTVDVNRSDPDEEGGEAYGWAYGAVVPPHDVICCAILVHEALHALQFDNSEWGYCTWAMEGITTYTKYKLRLYIEENYPDLVEYIITHNYNVTNYKIPDYDLLYSHSMEYWMDNVIEGPNANYSIGFRLMWFLEQTYGNYTKWITELEESYPCYVHSLHDGNRDNRLAKEKQMEAFYMAYGEDVFDKFYDWLKENEDICSEYRPIDLRGAKAFNTYPAFYSDKSKWKLTSMWDGTILYNDLYIGLDAGKKYLGEYKGKNINDLTLDISKSATVALYDEKGNLIKISEGVANSGKSEFKTLNLDGVSYIQLVGEGELHIFEIKGFK